MTISYASANEQIYAPALRERTEYEKRIQRIALLMRAISGAQRDADHYHRIGNEKGEQICMDFISRKKRERDALLVVPSIEQDNKPVTK
jgi:hypothetical protein